MDPIHAPLIGQREILQLSMETANNRIEINKINSDMISLEKQISDVAEGLRDVVTKSELADMMNSFVSDDDDKWLMFNAKFSSADEVLIITELDRLGRTKQDTLDELRKLKEKNVRVMVLELPTKRI